MLLTEVENNRTSLMVVLAGYKVKMQKLMRMDVGLERRFKGRLHLANYTPAELARICELRAKRQFKKKFEEGLLEKLAKHIGDFYRREIPKQNGGLAVNLTEAAIDRQIQRLIDAEGARHQGKSVAVGDDSLSPPPASVPKITSSAVTRLKVQSQILVAADFEIDDSPELGNRKLKKASGGAMSTHAHAHVYEHLATTQSRANLCGPIACARPPQDVETEVAALVGMENVKQFFQAMRSKAEFVERGGDIVTLQTSLNLILTGNPGTGKTTVARLIARYLHAYGILPTDRFKEVNGLDLKGQYVGQTAPKVQEAVADAMGGCLFVDEACPPPPSDHPAHPGALSNSRPHSLTHSLTTSIDPSIGG